MFVIRDQQMRALAEVKRRQYEEVVVRHITRFFPEQLARCTEQGVRELVPLGIGKCMFYGIERQCDVTDYIALMVVLGTHFDLEPANRWARDLLECEGMAGKDKIASLYDGVQALKPVSPQAAGPAGSTQEQ